MRQLALILCFLVPVAAYATDTKPPEPVEVPVPAAPVAGTVPPGFTAVPETFVNFALIYLSDRTGPAAAIFSDLKTAHDAQLKTPMACTPPAK